MKIWGEIPKILGISGKQKNVNKISKTEGTAPKRDVVSISSQAKDYQTIKKALRDIPDIRTDKVAELSDRYEAGKYDVKGSEVVDKIMKSIIDKKI